MKRNMLALVCMLAAVAPLYGAGDAAQTAKTFEDMTVMDAMQYGGWLMWVIAGISMIMVSFVVYFFFVLRVSQIAPHPLRRELQEKAGTGALDDVRRACEYKACPLSAVILAVLDYIKNNPKDENEFILRDVMEGEGARQAETIQGQTQYLLDIAVISPMVGLLGTVFGMLKAFTAIGLEIAGAKPVRLAEGISMALLTTAFGLIVAIPSMAFYAYFRRRAANLISSLETASSETFSHLMSKRDIPGTVSRDVLGNMTPKR